MDGGGPKKMPLFGGGVDGGEPAAVAAVGEDDAAADFGEEGVVRAAADVGAGLDTGAALADDDGAASDELAGEGFDAEALGVGIATVCGAASTFFVCHCRIS